MAVKSGSGEGEGSAVVELEFEVNDHQYPFVGASAVEECEFVLEEMVPRGNGAYAEFFSVSGGDADRILELADEAEQVEAHLISDYGDGGLFEFHVTDGCVAVTLAELGAIPRIVTGTKGEGRLVAELPPRLDHTRFIDQFLEEHPTATLTAKRQRQCRAPLFSRREFQHAVEEALTKRQQEVLLAAHVGGYYEWPRRATAEEIATELDIAVSTFTEHLRIAEGKLTSMLFGEMFADAARVGTSVTDRSADAD